MIWILKVKVKRDTHSSDREVNEVETVEVELDSLVVLSNFTRREDDWDFDFLVLARHQDLTRNYREVEVSLPLKLSLQRDRLGVEIGDLKDLLDRSRLCCYETLAEIKVVGVKLDTGFASFAC